MRGNIFGCRSDHCRNLFRSFNLFAGDVDHADQHVLALEQLEHVHRDMRMNAFQRYLIDPARGQCRKKLLVLPPFGAERRFPLNVCRNAVAVTDMHGGLAGQALDRTVQRLDSPTGCGFHVDVEGWLIELDDIDTIGGKPARLLIEQRGEGYGQLHPVAVMGVGDRIDDGHRTRQREFESFPGMRAR